MSGVVIVVVDVVDIDDPGPRCRLQVRMTFVNENNVWKMDRIRDGEF